MRLPQTFEEFRHQFTGPAKCAHKDCERLAKWKLQIRIWAKGHAKESSAPLTSWLDLKVCDQHQDIINPRDFWTDEGKRKITQGLRSIGRAEPDFDTSEFSWVPLSVL